MAIKENTKVNVYNNIFNRVGFNLTNGLKVNLDRNGQVREVKVEDLAFLMSTAPAMLTEGILFIKNEEVREYLGIAEFYENGSIIASDKLDEILEQSAKELERTVKNASHTAKKEIAKKASKKADELTGAQVKAIEKGTKTEITEKV
ncbi:MAG TPA: hypothetical protein VJY12_10600 [Dysgonamonadaceae bacterium]|nr:hypothetical protein [Dysgonamonadaceae bacterium]